LGKYMLSGRNVENLTDDELANLRNEKLGFVFQSFNLLAKETVYENVKLPLFYSDIPKKDWAKRVSDAIAAVKLDHRKDYLVQKLSGGEKQRVAIARALVCNPEVIFADEPTGNLDSVSGQAVMDTLRDLHEKGATILLITHEPNTARNAERIIRIKDGLVVGDEKVVDRAKKGEAVK
ncbi:MAG: ATP-binding cassette domain-containing protein, partial [Minisyncoccia bacterium]